MCRASHFVHQESEEVVDGVGNGDGEGAAARQPAPRLLRPGGVCRIVYIPYWLKGKVYVHLSVHPGRAEEEGRGKGRPTSGPFLQKPGGCQWRDIRQ